MSAPNKPKLLGIVNITEDSFSDGGRYLNPQAAIDHALALDNSGADIIDLGPSSSNPDAKYISPELEIKRLAPVVAALQRESLELSIDSFQPKTQRWAMDQDLSYLNDIEGFANPEIYPYLQDSRCKLFLMHSIQRRGIATRTNSDAGSIVDLISRFFEERISVLETAGIPRKRIILDPGMGFFLGSNETASVMVMQNIAVLKRRFGLPLLISVSRKSFLRKLTGRPVTEMGAASLAAELFAAMSGADFIRTHDTGALRDALLVMKSLQGTVLETNND